jgi:hypothetical protein
MTEKQFNRTRFADIMNHNSFIELDKQVQSRSTLPEYAMVPTINYWSGKKTNLLTAVCVYHLNKIEGWFASRQNSTGIPMKQGNGQIKWKPGGNAGAADIIAFGPGGVGYHYEIKFGNDKLSPKQIKYRDKIQKMGGHYVVVRKYEDLLAHLNTIPSRKINDQ